MEVGISNITPHQLALIHGTGSASQESRRRWDLPGMFRPIKRCVGVYEFLDHRFRSVDVEEICGGSSTLSYDDFTRDTAGEGCSDRDGPEGGLASSRARWKRGQQPSTGPRMGPSDGCEGLFGGSGLGQGAGMRLLITFARAYPGRSGLMLAALVLAGVAEGVGLSALLPLLQLATETRTGGAATEVMGGGTSGFVGDVLAVFGLTSSVGTLLAGIVLTVVLKSVLVLFAKKQVGYTVAHVATELRLRLLRSLFATRWEYYLGQPVGALANAVATEANRASSAYLFGASLAALLIQSAVYSGVAVMVSWRATVAALAAAICVMFLLSFLVKQSRRAGRRQTKLLKSLLVHLTDSLQSVKPLKAMGRESLADALLESTTVKLNRALQKKVLSKEALTAFQEPLFVSLIAVGLYVSLVRRGMPFASVMVLAFLLARVLLQLGKVQREYQGMASCDSAYWSLEATIQEAARAQEICHGTVTPSLQREIRLEGVNFSYGDRPVLAGADMVLPAGRLTTLVGPSGAGKTTIADLVTGLLSPGSGEVFVDGVSLSQLDVRQWRKMIGYVPQDTVLLHDTIFRNVILGASELGEKDVEEALVAAGAWEFVQAMPEGIHNTVGERGGKLSGGQRQRIAIARALVHRPKLLILDEATSALDPVSEAVICDALWRLRGEITILAISHQTALVDGADRVYHLENATLHLRGCTSSSVDGGSMQGDRPSPSSVDPRPDRETAKG